MIKKEYLSMGSRILLAVVVGYFLAILLSILFSKVLFLLGMAKANATLWAQIASFLIYACLIMWVFAVKCLKKISIQFFSLLIVSAIIVFVLRKLGI